MHVIILCDEMYNFLGLSIPFHLVCFASPNHLSGGDLLWLVDEKGGSTTIGDGEIRQICKSL